MTVERSTCGSGGCQSCPFSSTVEAETVYNYGCLPENNVIINLPKENNVVWGCHSDFNVICGGFAKQYKDSGNILDTSLPIVDFNEFTHLGLESAIALAKVRNGINPIKDMYPNNDFSGMELHDYTK